MSFQSIGARLTAWYISVLTATLLLLGGAAYGLLVYSLSRDMDLALSGVAEAMVRRAKADGRTAYPSDVDEIFRHFFGFSPLDRYIEMFDLRGRRDPGQTPPRSSNLPLSPEALENAARGLPTFETVHSNSPYPVRILTAPVIEAGRVINLVRVGMSMENTFQTRHRFLLILAGVLPLGILLAGGGGWLLARRALRPVDKMTRAAQRISVERLDQRLQERGSGDELDRLAKTLNDMLDRLNDAIHQMRRFSADASHELQTPLTILKGEMEVALRSARSSEEYRRVLRSGLEEIDRINHLVTGLLLLARADAGVLRLDRQPVDLADLLREIREQMKTVADVRAVSLDLETGEPVTVQGDREHLRRLVLNLVDNAIKYTPGGGRVVLSHRLEAGEAVLKVSDTGIGISGEEQMHIFSRFHRATETRSRDERGVGLGLSIARSIVEAHGGRIQVESTPDQGSTFTVWLPATPS